MEAETQDDPKPVDIRRVIDVSVDKIRTSPLQPRKTFDDEGIGELAQSIRDNGVLQPILVRPVEDGEFELVAGERRFRAAVEAGLRTIPAVVRRVTDKESLEIALIENLQREDINPVECAQAYRRLMDEFGMSQEQVAEKVGKSRSAVANTVRLLNLPLPILQSLERGEITEGHARAILALDGQEEQIKAWKEVLCRGLSVRETENLSRTSLTRSGVKVSRETRRHRRTDPHLLDIEDRLRRYLGTKVSITRDGSEKGRIEIFFYDDEDLMRILELMAQV